MVVTRIGIVGAGAASAALTYVVDGTTDAEVTVLEKSGGLNGRGATRRHDDLTYDYGANYLKSDDERVNDLVRDVLGENGLVDAAEPVYVFDREGAVSEGRDADAHKWSYEAGLTQIAKRLFGGTDARVERRTRVESVARRDESWWLTDGDGNEWGPFDVVVLDPPAPQTAALLRETRWDDPRRETLAEAAADVGYRAVYSAVLHYEFEVDVPYYALVNTDKEHDVGWISREECKAGHVPDGESLLVVQSSHEWAIEHYDDDPAGNVAALAAMTADIVGDERLADPVWTDHQGWRYALPEEGVSGGPVESAERAGLYCVGDWVAGEARLHTALRNGLETGERLALRIGE
jgi:predicted NAD/FAD-dependent oxidoreductase